MIMLVGVCELHAQTRPRRPVKSKPRNVTNTDGNIITINYPNAVDLTVFTDYVSRTLDLKIIYTDELKSQEVIFRPGEIQVPRDQLLDLLRSMLKMRGLALVAGEMDGWLQVVRTEDLQRHVKALRRDNDNTAVSSNVVVTQIVSIRSDNMAAISKQIRPFLSSGRASVMEIPDKGLLMITDYESSVAKALKIVELLDSDPVDAQVISIAIRHYDANTMADRVTQTLANKANLEGRKRRDVSIQADPNTGSVLVVGMSEGINEVQKLIRQFDVPSALTRPTVAYALTYISVQRLQNLIEEVLLAGSEQRSDIQLFPDEATNRLYVSAPQELHERIQALIKDEDVKAFEASRPVRIYKPKHRLAQELIGTLSEILPNVTSADITLRAGAVSESSIDSSARGNDIRSQDSANRQSGDTDSETLAGTRTNVQRVVGEDFVLTADQHTNSIIAIGPREFHAKIETLIEELDHRQPQVLIEMTLVAVTFNDSFSLAVELANEEQPGSLQSLVFSSFGISDIDIPTGVRELSPGGGLNGIILGPHETPIVVRAIAAHGNSRIIATPKIVLSDNTTATIANVEEEPFTSINASDTVATTSFAGFESAGTTMNVTAHIAQGDHLALDYSFSFSNFTGGSDVGVPPPRSTNSFSGTIELPDQHTVVLGGLVTDNETDSATEVPLLGRLPLIGALFQTSDRIHTRSQIFAFIKPTVLRDDQFADLKLITETEIEHAHLVNDDYPPSEFLWMR